MENIKVDFNLFYKIMYELTVVFESSKTANELILGLKQVFKRFFEINDVEIFSLDENSNLLKNFVKPWENLVNSEKNIQLTTIFDDFSKK